MNKTVFIGDSITKGFPGSANFSWVNLVAEKLQLDFYNKGINGDTTAQMLNRFQRDVLQLNPSHVIIMGGTNDAYNATNIDSVIHNIYTMIQLAIQHHIVPIVGLPIPCNDCSVEILLEQYREKLRQITFDSKISCIDFHHVMVEPSSNHLKEAYYCDGVHPSQFGYKAMADFAVTFLESHYCGKMIEKASINDYKKLIDIWELSVRATHHFITEEEIHFYKPLILDEYFKAVSLFTYKDEKGIINGFMGVADDKLEMLFIDPEHRSNGIGKRLLNFSTSQLGVKKVDVNEENRQAVDFYLHMGFRVVDRSELDANGKNHPILSMELTH